MQLDHLRKVVAHDLGHQHTVRKVACNRALWSRERDLIYPLVNALQFLVVQHHAPLEARQQLVGGCAPCERLGVIFWEKILV